jgi:hypothetical protein
MFRPSCLLAAFIFRELSDYLCLIAGNVVVTTGLKYLLLSLCFSLTAAFTLRLITVYLIIRQTDPWPSIFCTLFHCQGDTRVELCLANCLHVRAHKYKVYCSLICNEFCNATALDDLHNKKSVKTFGRQVFYKGVHCVPAWRRFPNFH